MKRILAVVALLVGVAVTSSVPVSTFESELLPEPIVRKMVVSSPQTSGPPGYNVPWGLDRIDQRTPVASSRSYAYSNDGTGVNIYVLDSGVSGTHSDFGSRVLSGWSYRANSTALSSYDSALAAWNSNPTVVPRPGIKPCEYDPLNHAVNPSTFDNPSQPVASDVGQFDNDGHGTHVAGIAAGELVGVAKNAKIIPVRALDSCGNGTTTMLLEALAWIRADHDAGERAVLNLSVGFEFQISSVDTAIINIINEGVLVAAAAGNSSTTSCGTTPADTEGIISIGSTTYLDMESDFSNYGSCVDIFAPGSAILSTYPYKSGVFDTYEPLWGTSMATPFVSGVMARYLQSLSTVPSSRTTGNDAFRTWLDSNATTNAITYDDPSRSPQTPNKLLYIPAPALPVQLTNVLASPIDRGAVVTWSGNESGVTYTATATPGSITCTVVGGSTCTLAGLTNGNSYSISVSGKNIGGTGPSATTTVVAGIPAPAPPEAPASAAATSKSKSVTLTWTASPTPGATYVVTSSPASVGCVTTATSCTIEGLTNGVNYTFTIRSQLSTVDSTTSTAVSIRPGFTVRTLSVKKGTRTRLTSIIATPSRGKKTWAESGPCSISSGRLVAPRRTTSCTLKLTVARSGSFPKMSTSVKVTVK